MSNMWRALECNLFIEINSNKLLSIISYDIQQENSLEFSNPVLNKNLKLLITEDTILTKSNSGVTLRLCLTKLDFLKLSSCDYFNHNGKIYLIKVTNCRKNIEDYIQIEKTSKIK